MLSDRYAYICGDMYKDAAYKEGFAKGFARRLTLALALLTPQPLLLMDEPFDGFDLRQTRHMMGLIRQVAAHTIASSSTVAIIPPCTIRSNPA